mmetsp:Transcript_7021/g.11793  ORF Transcript_7021/g.11793 Transcript_7021/m.11793 type:complete len:234 (-) Transcript_7021:658-1359(-)
MPRRSTFATKDFKYEETSSQGNLEDAEIDDFDFDQNEDKTIAHLKPSPNHEDFGLRYHSLRADFAQKHLFKCGVKDNQTPLDSEEDSCHEETISAQDQSDCESQDSNPDDEVSESNTFDQIKSVDQELKLEDSCPSSAALPLNSSDSAPISSSPQSNSNLRKRASKKPVDMIFACCDWEAAIDAEKRQSMRQKRPVFVDPAQQIQDHSIGENFSDSEEPRDDFSLQKIASKRL